jgi:peptide/nickel transport system permease protein
MWRFALNRLCLGLAITLVISLAVFVLTNVATDPAIVIAGEGASAKDIEFVRKSYGFDRPIMERYIRWLGLAASGDFGVSYRQHRPVYDIVFERLPVTFYLAVAALAFSLLLSLPLAMMSALWPNSLIDRLAMLVALIGQAMPPFWMALLCILVFSVKLGWLPASGSTTAAGYVMPAMALGLSVTPAVLRLTRAGLVEVLQSDYIRMARAKGLRMPAVIVKHALRNAVVPVISVASVHFGYMLAGSVVIETVFAMGGIGYLAWEAVTSADIPLIQALVLVTTFLYILMTLLADLLNSWIDPRLRIA